jgi:hypothetical protein
MLRRDRAACACRRCGILFNRREFRDGVQPDGDRLALSRFVVDRGPGPFDPVGSAYSAIVSGDFLQQPQG